MLNTAKWKKFENLAAPDQNGVSRWVTREEWENIGLTHTNGGDWNRSDGPLAKKYNIEKKYSTTGVRKIIAIRLNGFNINAQVRDHNINTTIRAQITARPSAILYVHSQNECDHKDGRYTNNVSNDVNAFQCLSKAENDAKRQHCKNCRESKKRFDASVLGYSVGWVAGDESSNNCDGCYWNDPIKFNAIISQNFRRK